MSSFERPHFFFLFRMRNGKRKISYGASPDDAYDCLRLRLSDAELAEVSPTEYLKIQQRELTKYVDQLG